MRQSIWATAIITAVTLGLAPVAEAATSFNFLGSGDFTLSGSGVGNHGTATVNGTTVNVYAFQQDASHPTVDLAPAEVTQDPNRGIGVSGPGDTSAGLDDAGGYYDFLVFDFSPNVSFGQATILANAFGPGGTDTDIVTWNGSPASPIDFASYSESTLTSAGLLGPTTFSNPGVWPYAVFNLGILSPNNRYVVMTPLVQNGVINDMWLENLDLLPVLAPVPPAVFLGFVGLGLLSLMILRKSRVTKQRPS